MAGNKIFLTGADFSRNFGLPLAKHVWGMILNHPKIQNFKKQKKKGENFFDEKNSFLCHISEIFNVFLKIYL